MAIERIVTSSVVRPVNYSAIIRGSAICSPATFLGVGFLFREEQRTRSEAGAVSGPNAEGAE
jgi:hypothetical protein